MERDLPIKLLSLFSGCGGMDLGFEGRLLLIGSQFPTDTSRKPSERTGFC